MHMREGVVAETEVTVAASLTCNPPEGRKGLGLGSILPYRFQREHGPADT